MAGFFSDVIMLLITIWIFRVAFGSVEEFFFSILFSVIRLCFYLAEELKSEECRRLGEFLFVRAVNFYGDNFLSTLYVAARVAFPI